MKRADLILTSDWHLREDQPECRTDDFFLTQWLKIKQISELQIQHDCPVFHAGDLFHHWKPSPYLLSETILALPKQFHTVYGQHDLPQHNLKLAFKCGVVTLKNALTLHTFDEGSWGMRPPLSPNTYRVAGREVFVWHKLVWKGKRPHWSHAPTARKILKKYPQYDLMVTGDNHSAFVYSLDGRLLVNPGCITRQEADKIDYKPRVYLWFAKTNTIKPAFLKTEHDVISREHIEKIEERKNRMEAFISRLNTNWEAETSFEKNLSKFFSKNKTKKSIRKTIRKAMDDQ